MPGEGEVIEHDKAKLTSGFYTAAQAGARLGYGARQTRDLIAGDEFPVRVIRLGRGRARISIAELERFIDPLWQAS